MIEVISPQRHSTIGGAAANSYSTLPFWHTPYIKAVFTWLTGIDVTDGWPDNQSGDTVYIYPIMVSGRTDSVRFSLTCANHVGVEYDFLRTDDFGVPIEGSYFHGFSNVTGTFHEVLPLAFSWMDPTTGVRDFAQGKRTVIAKTEATTTGDFEEASSAFNIDIRPPNAPIVEQDTQVVTNVKFRLTGSIPNVDAGSVIVKIRS